LGCEGRGDGGVVVVEMRGLGVGAFQYRDGEVLAETGAVM
jgi:hypothetical protein